MLTGTGTGNKWGRARLQQLHVHPRTGCVASQAVTFTSSYKAKMEGRLCWANILGSSVTY